MHWKTIWKREEYSNYARFYDFYDDNFYYCCSVEDMYMNVALLMTIAIVTIGGYVGVLYYFYRKAQKGEDK